MDPTKNETTYIRLLRQSPSTFFYKDKGICFYVSNHGSLNAKNMYSIKESIFKTMTGVLPLSLIKLCHIYIYPLKGSFRIHVPSRHMLVRGIKIKCPKLLAILPTKRNHLANNFYCFMHIQLTSLFANQVGFNSFFSVCRCMRC